MSNKYRITLANCNLVQRINIICPCHERTHITPEHGQCRRSGLWPLQKPYALPTSKGSPFDDLLPANWLVILPRSFDNGGFEVQGEFR
eukprot:5861824-Amphidinium_carterae.1